MAGRAHGRRAVKMIDANTARKMAGESEAVLSETQLKFLEVVSKEVERQALTGNFSVGIQKKLLRKRDWWGVSAELKRLGYSVFEGSKLYHIQWSKRD
jgi:hypothetical protein